MTRFEKVLKDPVHDEIVVDDPWVWQLINTAVVQRLRRIRQLGTSYLTFHGAEHSRFTHSLGAYETMRRALHHLEREYGWPKADREKKLALAAALLHDVGHGPFSHTFESVYPIHHEEWTRRILLEDAELSSVLCQIDTQFAADLVGIFTKANGYTYIQQLITSQLDVDRMDYLLRDALHTGVSYGRFELARLLRSFAIADGELTMKLTALHTVEQYILARYFMYTQVYLHPVTVGSDVLVGQILLRAGHLLAEGHEVPMPKELRALVTGDSSQVSVADYLALDESTLVYAFRLWSTDADEILADLSSRFLHRRLFAPIICSEPIAADLAGLRTAARALGFHPDYYVCGRHSSVAGYVYRGEGIQLVAADGERTELSRVSRLVRTLVPDSEFRLFMPKEMLDNTGLMGNRIRSIVNVLSHTV